MEKELGFKHQKNVLKPIGDLLPEMCTLDCGSVNMGDAIYLSPASWLRKQAQMVKDAGVASELECFDTGHVSFAKQMIEEGLIDGDPMFQFCFRYSLGCRK